MYVCVRVCIYIYIYIYIYHAPFAYTYTYTYIFIHTHTTHPNPHIAHTFTPVYINTHIHTHAYIHTTHQGRTPTKTSARQPTARAHTAACLLPGDLLSKRVVIFGGEEDSGAKILDDTYVMDASNVDRMDWTRLGQTDSKKKNQAL
jgi:hypothetical protein